MKTKLLIGVALILIIPQVVLAIVSPQVSVVFDKPEKFTDFQTRASSNVKDRENLMLELERLIKKSSKTLLNKNIQLQIIIEDVDMAGRYIFPGGSIDLRNNLNNLNNEEVRVVRESDRVGLEFDYKLLDQNGSLIKQGHAQLTNRHTNISSRINNKYQHSNFINVMPLFDRWLKTIQSE